MIELYGITYKLEEIPPVSEDICYYCDYRRNLRFDIGDCKDTPCGPNVHCVLKEYHGEEEERPFEPSCPRDARGPRGSRKEPSPIGSI